MKKLSLGIYEEEEELEEKKKKPRQTPCDKVRGNPYHGSDGRFLNTDDETGKPEEDFVYSKYHTKKCGARAKGKANTFQRQAIPNVKDCGSGKKKKGRGQYRCRDNYRLWEEDDDYENIQEHFKRFI